MNPDARIPTLRAQLSQTCDQLVNLQRTYRDFWDRDFPKLGPGTPAALVVGGLIENYYTCAETLFWRISQYFENHLEADRWHTELLGKMTLEIDRLRVPVIGPVTFANLSELRKFRHFRRYYFSVDYDWDKILFLRTKLEQVHPLLLADLAAFDRFLEALAAEDRP